MTETQHPAEMDPRPLVRATQAYVADLIDNVHPEQLSLPTPCTDFDVKALLEHFEGIEMRLSGVAGGRPADDFPTAAPLPEGNLGDAFRATAGEAIARWDDDATLSQMVVAPFGTVPGHVFLAMYAMEHLAHGWDLAVATGQQAEADPQVAEAVLAIAKGALPPGDRGPFPFAADVAPAADAGPTEQLANYLGRTSR